MQCKKKKSVLEYCELDTDQSYASESYRHECQNIARKRSVKQLVFSKFAFKI